MGRNPHSINTGYGGRFLGGKWQNGKLKRKLFNEKGLRKCCRANWGFGQVAIGPKDAIEKLLERQTDP